MTTFKGSFWKRRNVCIAFLLVLTRWSAAADQAPADLEAQEVARVKEARERHDANGLVALADEYEARWKRGERGEHILKALDKLAMTSATWEWDDFRRQIEFPRQIGLFVLENAPSDIALEIQVDMAVCVVDALDQHAPSFTAAERKRRALLASRVLRRVLAKVDPTVDLSALVLLNVSPPAGVPHAIPGMDPKAIKNPALRAEYERRIRENALLAQRKSEQYDVLRLKKRLLLPFERYLTSVYSSDPEAGPELERILADVKVSARGNASDVDAMAARVTQAVRSSYTSSRPGN